MDFAQSGANETNPSEIGKVRKIPKRLNAFTKHYVWNNNCRIRILPGSLQMSWTSLWPLQHQIICVFIDTEWGKRACLVAFTIPGWFAETICSSANGMPKSEILVHRVADFGHICIYSEHYIAPLKLFVTRESFWFCNLLVALRGLKKHFFLKIHRPTLLHLQRHCTGHLRILHCCLSEAACTLSALACRLMWFFEKTMNVGIFDVTGKYHIFFPPPEK